MENQQTVVRRKKKVFVVKDKKISSDQSSKIDKPARTRKQANTQQKKRKLSQSERDKIQRKMDKAKRKGVRYLERAQSLWPQLFTDYKPLAIGIRQQLENHDLNEMGKTWVRIALRMWCSNLNYTKALAKGGPRYGMKGEQGEVSEEHKKIAKEAVKKFYDKKKKIKQRQHNKNKQHTQT